jgi:acyl dehydratase
MESTPNGIFDRSTAGQETAPVDVDVEKGRIVFFSEVIGETDPIYFDAEAASRAGYPNIVAPPTFSVVLGELARQQLERKGEPSIPEIIRCDMRLLLHGNEAYDFYGVFFAGDIIKVKSEVLGFADKKGGQLEFATVKTTFEHAVRGTIVVATRTLLHKLEPSK